RLLRWQRVAREAAKQAGRIRPLGINPPSDLEHFVRATREADLKLTLWEGERERLLRHLLAAAGSVRWVSILVGPEGGLSAEEVELAAGKGYLAVNLGPRIMRTETAALAVLAILQHRWGGMG
ncbi:MAG: RsmE family RNA methyltransferase, partial [Nitrospinota bacterium]